MRVELVHDYLTQRGGAERVVLALARAFPGAPLTTSLYDRQATFPEFSRLEVRTLPLDRVALLRRRHRLALPLLARAFASARLDADVVVCSSSGWAHGVGARGRKLVYCHTPARWLYQPGRYLRGASPAARLLAAAARPPLRRWDRAAAASADLYVANSRAVAERVAQLYGIEARVLTPPPALGPGGPTVAVEGLEPGFVLCVARLLPYKNLDALLAALALRPRLRLALVGTGPEERRLRALAPSNVRLLGAVADAELRWLYGACALLVSPAHEDLGLTPLEAASFGKPTAALGWGGFLDTVLPGRTGVLFERAEASAIADAIDATAAGRFDAGLLRRHASGFGEDRFVAAIRELVEELGDGAPARDARAEVAAAVLG